MTEPGGRILDVDIDQKMRESYLEYSLSVIISRAIPDVRDGLKPVQRRVMVAMNDLGLQPGKPYRKCAKITGDTTGNYHPHGTTSVYDTLARLAQDFSLRYPLVDGQGNFGSIDGDAPAAERYTEARLARFATELMRDLEKETVDFVPNYDGSRMMPSVLPSAVPNLLVNGSAGIAVGMATNIPPHNIGEVCDGLAALLDDPDLAPADLLQYVQGPDFPTAGIVQGRQGIHDYVTTGRGRVVVRARAEIDEDGRGRPIIVITELPYQVNKAALLERIAQLVREGSLDGISDLRDESDRDGLRVIVVLKRDAVPRIVLNKLFAHTPLQTTFGVINLALVDNKPRVMSLKEAMQEYLKFREEVVIRRTRYDLRQAEERAHILEGYRIALDHIDEIVALIRHSESPATAKAELMARFGLSEIQAQAILDLRLARLTGLERQKIEAEYLELIQLIAELKAILASRARVLQIIREELLEVKAAYEDPRRTEIVADEGEFAAEDLIADENVVITISHDGYIKRTALDAYRRQGRGGKGITAAVTKAEDFVEHLFIASTHQYLLVMSQKGKCYWLKVHEIPSAARAARGKSIVNLIQVESGDQVYAVVPVREFRDDHYLVMATSQGVVKKTALVEFSRPRRVGIRAITLAEGERLVAVTETDGRRDIILATSDGMSIRFPESDIRPMGRDARGVRGVTLRKGAEVVGMVVVHDRATLLAITENGYGKRSPLEDYRPQRRGGRGLITIKTTERNGALIDIKEVADGEELMVISRNGIMIRLAVKDISTFGRNTQGVRIISLNEGDLVVAVAKLAGNGKVPLEGVAGAEDVDPAAAAGADAADEPAAAEEAGADAGPEGPEHGGTPEPGPE
jgi:DNA gyrase subunit A